MPGMQILPTDRAVIEIQEGLQGASNWKGLALINDISALRMGAISGSKLTVSRWKGRYEINGRLTNIGSARGGDVPVFSYELQLMDTGVGSVIDQLNGMVNMRIRYFQGEYTDPTNYRKIRLLSRAWNLDAVGGEYSRDMANSFEGYQAQNDPQLRKFSFEADALLEIDPCVRQKLSASVTTLAIKDICSIGYARWAGEVTGENTNNLGNKEFVFITAKASAGQPSKVFYSADKGGTWSSTNTLNDFDGSGICKAGRYIVISATDATGGGLAYATVDSVRAGTATWTRSTGVAAGQLVRHVRKITDTMVIAVGASGAVWISTDSGRSFSSLTAVTANNLNWIAVAGEDLVYFGGATQTLVRYYKGSQSVVTVTGLTGTINSLAVPPGIQRAAELYVASSDGSIRKTINGTATTPTFSLVRLESGVSSADALAFGGPNGDVLWVAETNGSSQSRLVRDLSGGYGGADVETLGDFTSPANSTIDSIAAPSDHVNTAMSIGPVNTSQGYIELAA